jgi:hypothetical protein
VPNRHKMKNQSACSLLNCDLGIGTESKIEHKYSRVFFGHIITLKRMSNKSFIQKQIDFPQGSE